MSALQKAYCCAELRTGVGLIGWLGTIGTSIILFYFCNHLLNSYVFETTLTLKLYQLKADWTIWEITIFLLKWCFYFCASFLLIVAALKKKEALLLPWLVVVLVDIMVLGYNVLYMGFAGKPWTVFFISLALLFIALYNWLIVYSFYQERAVVKSRNNQSYISWKR